MTNTLQLFELAQLAEASYAHYWDEKTNKVIQADDDIVAAIIASGFSQNPSDPNASTQASELTQHWRVVSHQPNTANGFSATLFQRIDDDPIAGFQAGQYVYAIRGTEPDNSADLSTDNRANGDAIFIVSCKASIP